MIRLAVYALGAAAAIGLAVAGADFYLHRVFYKQQFGTALQQYCARKSEQIFTAKGWRFDGRPVTVELATYRVHHQSRYNVHLRKCFMLLTVITNDRRDRATRISSNLVDAYSQETYGEYFESRTPEFPAFISPCKLSVPHRAVVSCHSAQEWNRLVGPYIGPQALTE